MTLLITRSPSYLCLLGFVSERAVCERHDRDPGPLLGLSASAALVAYAVPEDPVLKMTLRPDPQDLFGVVLAPELADQGKTLELCAVSEGVGRPSMA